MTSVGRAPCPALAPVTSPRFLMSPSRPSGASRLFGVHTWEPYLRGALSPQLGRGIPCPPGGAAMGASGGHSDVSLTRFQAESAERQHGGRQCRSQLRGDSPARRRRLLP